MVQLMNGFMHAWMNKVCRDLVKRLQHECTQMQLGVGDFKQGMLDDGLVVKQDVYIDAPVSVISFGGFLLPPHPPFYFLSLGP